MLKRYFERIAEVVSLLLRNRSGEEDQRLEVDCLDYFGVELTWFVALVKLEILIDVEFLHQVVLLRIYLCRLSR